MLSSSWPNLPYIKRLTKMFVVVYLPSAGDVIHSVSVIEMLALHRSEYKLIKLKKVNYRCRLGTL